jgi:3-oxoacyl-[acyl-carrier protein] reductase
MVQLLLEGMKNKGFGRIINIISTSIKAPLPNLGVSNTIRGAVAQWAKTLATELAPFGITVNNVLPGATSTLRLDGIIENRSNKSGLEKVVVREEMLNEIPAKRFGRPEEVAYAVCFLASDKASYVTGINLPVDGGRTPSL